MNRRAVNLCSQKSDSFITFVSRGHRVSVPSALSGASAVSRAIRNVPSSMLSRGRIPSRAARASLFRPSASCVFRSVSHTCRSRGTASLVLACAAVIGTIAYTATVKTMMARSFGLTYRRQFSLALALACGLAASAVGVVGPIVFVGLIVPHLARFLAGKHFSLVLPLTIALGVITVTLGDLVGRLLGQAEEIPIGVITAICGVPVLIALLRRTP